jgi:hypothetical protein
MNMNGTETVAEHDRGTDSEGLKKPTKERLDHSRNVQVTSRTDLLYNLCSISAIVTNNSVALVRERTIPTDRHLSAKLVPTFLRAQGATWSA